MRPYEKPDNIFQTIGKTQILLASVSGSMFAVVAATYLNLVINIFRPDFLQVLVVLRVSIAGTGLSIAAITGISGIIKLFNFLIELLDIYKKLKEIKKNHDKENDTAN